MNKLKEILNNKKVLLALIIVVLTLVGVSLPEETMTSIVDTLEGLIPDPEVVEAAE